MRFLVIAVSVIVGCDTAPKSTVAPAVPGRVATTLKQPTAPASSPAAKSSRPEPFRVGGEVSAPVIVRRVDPVYPEYRGTYRQGILLLECVVTNEGDVRDLRVLKGPGNSFEHAILDAVKQWKFKPGTLHGEPVDVIYNLSVNHVPYGPGV